MTLPPSLPSNPSQLLLALSYLVLAMEEDRNLHIILIEAELGDVRLAQSKKLTPPSVVSEA